MVNHGIYISTVQHHRSTPFINQKQSTNKQLRSTPISYKQKWPTSFLDSWCKGVMFDRVGHLCNATWQKLDDQGAVISDLEAAVVNAANGENAIANAEAAAVEDALAAWPRKLVDFNWPDQYYAKKSIIRPFNFQWYDFELKPTYFTLVGQHPYHKIQHEHSMDHFERFEDLVSSIKSNWVPDDYLFRLETLLTS